jgi:hypothetical protein
VNIAISKLREMVGRGSGLVEAREEVLMDSLQLEETFFLGFTSLLPVEFCAGDGQSSQGTFKDGLANGRRKEDKCSALP